MPRIFGLAATAAPEERRASCARQTSVRVSERTPQAGQTPPSPSQRGNDCRQDRGGRSRPWRPGRSSCSRIQGLPDSTTQYRRRMSTIRGEEVSASSPLPVLSPLFPSPVCRNSPNCSIPSAAWAPRVETQGKLAPPFSEKAVATGSGVERLWPRDHPVRVHLSPRRDWCACDPWENKARQRRDLGVHTRRRPSRSGQ